MKIFSENVSCPKCGCAYYAVTYTSAGPLENMLRITCQRCGYFWHVWPLDYKADCNITKEAACKKRKRGKNE